MSFQPRLRSTTTAASLVLISGLGWWLTACNSGPDKAGTAATSAPETAPTTTPAGPTDTPGTWYRQYRALLPGTPDSVTLHLQNFGATPGEFTHRLAGFYAGPDGRPWELMGEQNAAAPDSITLHDTSPGKVDANFRSPQWRLKRIGTTLAGTLDGQPVRLRLVQPPQGVGLSTRAFADSVAPRLSHPQDSVLGRFRLHALLPGSGPSQRALTASILRDLRGDTLARQAAPTLESYWLAEKEKFAKDYREDVAPLLAESEADTSSYRPKAMFNYEAETSTYVLWNAGRLLSLGFLNYSYSGGAHGNYATTVRSYDTRSGQPLTFNDIFRPGAEAQLENLLGQYARPSLGLQPNEPLKKALFRNTLPLTRNVYLTSSGAVFVYAPYEVASYAQGEIRIFVPFSALKPLLQPGLPVGGAEVARQ